MHTLLCIALLEIFPIENMDCLFTGKLAATGWRQPA